MTMQLSAKPERSGSKGELAKMSFLSFCFETSTTPALDPAQTMAGTYTSNPLTAKTGCITGEDLPDSAELVKELKELSGLTIDQIGRIFGVSRRSVHNWMKGSRMSSPNEERLAELLAQVRDLPSDTPEGRRRILLSSKNGRSLLNQWVLSAPQGEVIKVKAFTPKELLGL